MFKFGPGQGLNRDGHTHDVLSVGGFLPGPPRALTCMALVQPWPGQWFSVLGRPAAEAAGRSGLTTPGTPNNWR